MDLFDQVDRVEKIGLACTWCTAAYVHTGHCTLAAQEHGAAGQCLFILCLPHLDAAHIRDGIPKCHQASFRMQLFTAKVCVKSMQQYLPRCGQKCIKQDCA